VEKRYSAFHLNPCAKGRCVVSYRPRWVVFREGGTNTDGIVGFVRPIVGLNTVAAPALDLIPVFRQVTVLNLIYIGPCIVIIF
jgi:hypothetical protein